MKEREVPILTSITPEEFYQDYFLKNSPCLIRGGAADWPAVQKWTEDEYLRKVAGQRIIAETTSLREDVGFNHQSPQQRVKFGDFLSRYRGNPQYYINDCDLPSILVPDIGTHEIFQGFDRLEAYHKRVGFFLGAGGQFAPLHYDDEENLYVLIDGEKEFILFDIADFAKMYPHDNLDGPDFSQIDMNAIDYQAFPLLQEVISYKAYLYPGDILYVPGYWWHAVRSQGRNMALSYIRTDRISQLLAYIKLVKNDALPITESEKQAMLEMLANRADTALETQQEYEIIVKEANIFTLYMRLGIWYEYLTNRGKDVMAVKNAFTEVKGRIVKELQEKKYSYPVLFLMQNFYRVNAEISWSWYDM